MGTGRPFPCHRQDFRAECRQDDSFRWNSGRFEPVEISADLVERPRKLLGGFGMSDPYSQEEAVGMRLIDPVIGSRDHVGVRSPHIDDARYHRNPLGGGHKSLDLGEVGWRRTHPDRPETESPCFPGLVCGYVSQPAPDSELS